MTGRKTRSRPSPAAERERRLRALNDAALAIAGDLDLDRVLEKILKTAAKLVGARYGALGIPDAEGGSDVAPPGTRTVFQVWYQIGPAT